MAQITRTALVGFNIVTAQGPTLVPINNFNFSAFLNDEDKPIGPDIGVYTGVIQFRNGDLGYFWVAASIELNKAEDGTATLRYSTLVDSTYPGQFEITEMTAEFQTVTRQVNEAFELVWSMVEFTELPDGGKIAQLRHKDGRKAALTITPHQIIEKIHLDGTLVYATADTGQPVHASIDTVKEIQHNFFVQRYSEAMFRASSPVEARVEPTSLS